MLTVEEARIAILSNIERLGIERVALPDSLGRVIAVDVIAPGDIPGRDNTAMDGYAVIADDTTDATDDQPVELTVIETVPAGYVAKKSVSPGCATRIMTGAWMPEGADAIVIVEHTSSDGSRVLVRRPTKAGAHIRRRGEDIREGQRILGEGTELGPGEIGLLASIGKGYIRVFRRPRVAIVSTGDELVELDETPGDGQIVNSNAFSLGSLVRESGCLAVLLPIARDTLGEISHALAEAAKADFILTSGGVSVGEFDYVKQALDGLGATTKFWRVAMKPGKPLVFATLNDRPFFGLPGNPVSCMVSFNLFVRPALRKAMGIGADRLMRPTVRATLTNDVRSTGDRLTFQRAVIVSNGDRLEATTKPAQGSGVLSSMVGANGLVIVPEGVTHLSAGDDVAVQMIGSLF